MIFAFSPTYYLFHAGRVTKHLTESGQFDNLHLHVTCDLLLYTIKAIHLTSLYINKNLIITHTRLFLELKWNQRKPNSVILSYLSALRMHLLCFHITVVTYSALKDASLSETRIFFYSYHGIIIHMRLFIFRKTQGKRQPGG
jgi:hypothetical protein